MFKFVCVFAMLVASCYAGGYGSYQKPVVAGYEYQIQPRATVQVLVPVSYGHGAPYNVGYSAPSVHIPSYQGSVAYKAQPDAEALALAKLALSLPDAGAPIAYPNSYSAPVPHIIPAVPIVAAHPAPYSAPVQKVIGGTASAAGSAVSAPAAKAAY